MAQESAADMEARTRASFERQAAMKAIGATVAHVAPGEVDLRMPYDAALSQQHGFVHAGIIATLADSACGYAAFTLMPEDGGVLSIEFKTNLLSPARGERFRFVGKVVKAGRTISVCEGQAFAGEKLVATMTCTLMAIKDRADVTG